ncbi:hypothetical protein FW774_07350 [Pedobacter sp. BS3]|uniref:DUF5689 domain-containing protein n=1 Tax=Pedobacter sp. BS3 TaxID=2567937 RepID=UPI0011ED6E9E|nr:DUF5689 domain-containing protein [Pedobacter sp. BS3]TZF84786.1 hypothetical protein FW774_07350 [Pedobacter sp. BS3]
MKKILNMILPVLVVITWTSCKDNPEFAKGTPGPTISLETLRNLYKDSDITLSQDAMNGAYRISGIVISDAASGNIPSGNIVVQNTARGATRGITIPLGTATVPVALGDSVIISVVGKRLVRVNGAMQLTGVTAGDITVVSSNNVISSRQVAFTTLISAFSDYESTLVQAVNVNIDPVPAPNETYSGDKQMNDGAYLVTLHTEPSAVFANEKIPEYAIFTGIALMNTSGVQLWMRNQQDAVAVPQYVVSDFAGTTSGYADGTLTTAKFKSPEGIEFDPQGNLYVADRGNNRIRKIAPDGKVTTLAGSGTAAFADGTGLAASFNGPWDLTTDTQGNVYVADQNNQRVRKITPAGVVTTYAGSGIAGLVNGAGDIAQLNNPLAIAFDKITGNILVGENANHLIRRVAPDRVVSTFAGNGSGFADGVWYEAQFKQPSGVAADAQGNVYVADRANHRIRKITPDGMVSTLAGAGTAGSNDGSAATARFNNPYGVAVDAHGNVYVADLNNHKIRCVLTSGIVITVAGTGTAGSTSGAGNVAQLNQPTDLAIAADGSIYVADLSNNKVRKITPVD